MKSTYIFSEIKPVSTFEDIMNTFKEKAANLTIALPFSTKNFSLTMSFLSDIISVFEEGLRDKEESNMTEDEQMSNLLYGHLIFIDLNNVVQKNLNGIEYPTAPSELIDYNIKQLQEYIDGKKEVYNGLKILKDPEPKEITKDSETGIEFASFDFYSGKRLAIARGWKQTTSTAELENANTFIVCCGDVMIRTVPSDYFNIERRIL